MLDFIRDKLRRLKQDEVKPAPRMEFNLRGRTEEAMRLLLDAAKISEHIMDTGADFQHKGYSTGGFTAEIATSNGLKDGPPKMDPVTILVNDKTGSPLFTIELVTTDSGGDLRTKGATPAVQDKLDNVPEGLTPADQIACVMSALTPADEIGASVASVRQGRLVFGTNAVAQVVASKEAATAKRVAEENAARERETVQDATVLQAPTIVSGPLKLKNPKS